LEYRVERGAREVGSGDAGDLDGILECEEEPGLRTLLGLHLQQRLAVIEDLAFGNFESRVAGQNLGKGGLPRPVRPHYGMHFASVDGKVYAAKDRLAVYGSVEVFDCKHRC